MLPSPSAPLGTYPPPLSIGSVARAAPSNAIVSVSHGTSNDNMSQMCTLHARATTIKKRARATTFGIAHLRCASSPPWTHDGRQDHSTCDGPCNPPRPKEWQQDRSTWKSHCRQAQGNVRPRAFAGKPRGAQDRSTCQRLVRQPRWVRHPGGSGRPSGCGNPRGAAARVGATAHAGPQYLRCRSTRAGAATHQVGAAKWVRKDRRTAVPAMPRHPCAPQVHKSPHMPCDIGARLGGQGGTQGGGEGRRKKRHKIWDADTFVHHSDKRYNNWNVTPWSKCGTSTHRGQAREFPQRRPGTAASTMRILVDTSCLAGRPTCWRRREHA